MADPLTTLCEKIRDALAGGSWPVAFTPRVAVLPIMELTDTELHVLVLQGSDVKSKAGIDTVATIEETFDVEIVVQKKLGEDQDPERDVPVLLELCGEIQAFLLNLVGTTLPDLGDYPASCSSTGRDPAYDLERLYTKREFYAVIGTTWNAWH